MMRIDMGSSVDEPYFAFLEMLFEPDRPLSEMAVLMLLVALAGKDADVKGHAVDAMAETIQDGRTEPAEFSRVFVKLQKGGWLKLNRITDALTEISRFSDLHTYVVAGILRGWLEKQTELPRDGHYVLSLLSELLNQLGWALTDEQQLPLKEIKGSSKTAKLAKSLLKLGFTNQSSVFKGAMLLQLESRIDRALRWQG